MLVIVVCILIILSILSILYIAFLKLQLRGINKDLTKRLTEHTRKPLTLALFNKELNTLASNINRCLKEEENLRLEAIREEKHFKEMISDISHDLRTPLTAIKGYQQLIAKGTLTDDERGKLKIAQKHADELGALIEHFFEYTYLINAEPKFKIEKLNLTNITAECIAEAVAIFEKNNLKVNFYEDPPVFAMGDKEAVIRIIQNLIRNCVQHADSNIDVQILAEQSAVISFRNFVKEGTEIDINRLFDRFYIADKARSKTTGLGLSIVKLLAEQMGGSTDASLKDGILDIQVRIPLF
ncbi:MULTISPECIES: sensor histidine kinase [Clostridium]|uniref:sensor histidine kinase n=1 Tax=Clostridium TaxID=1485 RepID=UPI00082708CB|nr:MULTISPECIES: HAMP domain-containing sensor histidine kinase [Clostridium]PJI07558.1 sensor histidine kinase [Clostridium sp. CT7]